MSEEIRYKISYDQSVSTGFIGFHGSVEFNDIDNHRLEAVKLKDILKNVEEVFRAADY